MDKASHVPELRENPAPRGVHRIDDGFPRLDLPGRPYPRRIGPAQAFTRDAGGFGYDEAGAGALGIIFGHERGRFMRARCARTRQRRHEDAVRDAKGADPQGLEQGWHDGSP